MKQLVSLHVIPFYLIVALAEVREKCSDNIPNVRDSENLFFIFKGRLSGLKSCGWSIIASPLLLVNI